MRKYSCRNLLILLTFVAFLGLLPATIAQIGPATVLGTVSDASGLPIAGASVVVKNTLVSCR
jgi:hypothetical protein